MTDNNSNVAISNNESYNLTTLSTGNRELDLLLGGGIPQGSLIALVGAPGTGKTTLIQQLCFGWQAATNSANVSGPTEIVSTPAASTAPAVSSAATTPVGSRALYFSLLSESHTKMLSHISKFDFFDAALVNDRIKLFSLTSMLGQDYKAIVQLIVKTARQEKAGLVTLDGYVALAEALGSRSASRLFLYALSSQLSILGVTSVVSIERPIETNEISEGDLTVADGILNLTSRLDGAAEFYQIQVRKLRGMKRLPGVHSYAITERGVEFYPRLESLIDTSKFYDKTVEQADNAATLDLGGSNSLSRLGFGLPELEALMDGGVPEGSSTLIAGSPGAGKTLLSLHYLMEGANRGEAGLYMGFYENEQQLFRKAANFGMDLVGAVQNKLIKLICLPPVELDPDRIALMVRQQIESQPVKRMVVDGFIELENACRSTKRSRQFATAFETYLQQYNISSLYTHEIDKLVGSELDLSQTPFTALAENLLLLRQGEYDNQLYRIISVLKMRDSDYDRYIRELRVEAGKGIRVLPLLQSAEGLLTGLAHKLDNTSATS